MDIKYMQKALEIAQLSGEDIPVGAVLVKDDKILACYHNEKEQHNDVTAHAEMLALKEASKKYSSNLVHSKEILADKILEAVKK